MTPRAFVAVIGALLALAGCSSETVRLDITFSRVSFSERLRPDIGPLDLGQQSQVPQNLSDGGPSGAELVSPLYPGQTSPENVRSMRVSDVLWTGRSSVVLSWEVAVWDPLFNGTIPTLTTEAYGNTIGGPPTKRLAVNTRGIVQPTSRKFLVYEDQILDRSRSPAGFYPTIPGFTVAVVACTDGVGRGDPANLPVALDQRCAKRAADTSLCLDQIHSNSFLPMTAIKCRVTITTDSSLRLEVVDVNDLSRTIRDVLPSVAHDPSPLLPHVKIVSGERILRRPLAFEPGSETCLMRPAAGGDPVACAPDHLEKVQLWRMCRHEIPVVPPIICSGLPPGLTVPLTYDSLQSRWAWNVVDPGTGRWRENFTDDLQVSFVKLFLVKRDGTSRYLTPDEVRFLDVGHQRCVPSAESGTGEARVDTTSCENLRIVVSPAWAAPTFGDSIDWRVRLIARAQDNVTVGPIVGTGVLMKDLAALPSDQLFVEFHVVKTGP